MLPLNLDQYLVYDSLTPAHGAYMEINTQLKATLQGPEAANRETLQAAVCFGYSSLTTLTTPVRQISIMGLPCRKTEVRIDHD